MKGWGTSRSYGKVFTKPDPGLVINALWERARRRMVERQIVARGVSNPGVLEAMRTVPRHEFVPSSLRRLSYTDRPLSIGYDQTISQPYIVAVMTELAGAAPSRRILEIGTGSGYQTAVLSATGADVFTIERDRRLALPAARRLHRLGYTRIATRVGDGREGWPEEAPFDAILVAAAADQIPAALPLQLAPDGCLVIPVGPPLEQELLVIRRTGDDLVVEQHGGVRFVPLQ